jgi:N-acetylmuramoyl-L-alanine amidase
MTDMGTYHIVEQGECLSSIAKEYKFSDYRTIYNHPENAEFKQKRPNPNIIYPGDRLFIPDTKEKTESRSSDQQHQFVVKSQRVLLRLVVKDDQDQPFANKKYKLRAADLEFQGRTDGRGLLQHFIPADAAEGELKVWTGSDDETKFHGWRLSIGHLDPPETVTGAQARLNNLGIFCGAVDGIIGPITEEALKEFQAKNKLPQTGKLDAATRNLLRDKHDLGS